MPEIRVAIAGVGNCASSLIQGIFHYARQNQESIGLMHNEICGYKPGDIKIVAAFDIDKRKVGRPLEEAIFAPPNCTKTIEPNIPATGVSVLMGHVFDGVAPHMQQYPPERTFVVSDAEPVNVGAVLEGSKG